MEGVRLRLRLVVRVVPLLLHLLGIGRRVRRAIVLWVMVRDVGVVMDWRMCLRRDVVVVLVITLAPSLMERHGWRYVRAWHHGRQARCCLHSQALAGDQAANV